MHRVPVIVFCLLFLLVAGAVLAPEHAVSQSKSAKEKKIKENRSKRDKVFDKIRELNRNRDNIEDVIAIVDSKVDALEKEITNITNQLDQVTRECDNLKVEQQELETTIVEKRSQLADRARAIYMQGEFTYLEMVIQAESSVTCGWRT